jgi:hypothetical protein
MREPLFVEFVDECLRVVDPQPSDITDEQVSLFDSFASYKNRSLEYSNRLVSHQLRHLLVRILDLFKRGTVPLERPRLGHISR